MAENSSPKKKPAGGNPVGFAKPPKATQFQPGKSGNPKGRPKGRPSLDELLREEIARVVKVKIGDQIVPMDKDRALQRKLIDMAIIGDIGAARLVFSRLDPRPSGNGRHAGRGGAVDRGGTRRPENDSQATRELAP